MLEGTKTEEEEAEKTIDIRTQVTPTAPTHSVSHNTDSPNKNNVVLKKLQGHNFSKLRNDQELEEVFRETKMDSLNGLRISIHPSIQKMSAEERRGSS